MIHGASDEFVKPIKSIGNRIPVLLTDYDGDAWIHALTLAPKGVTLAQARQTITEAFTQARNENPDEWNYDDVTNILEVKGYNCLAVAIWEEQRDGYPQDDGKCPACGQPLQDDVCQNTECDS